MKIVNRYGIPEIFVDAYNNLAASYDKGEDVYLSATGLIAPPQIRVLKEKYNDLLEVDITDRLYMLEGNIAHGMLEAAVYGDPMSTLQRLRSMAKRGVTDIRAYWKEIKHFFLRDADVVPEERLYGYVDVPGYGRVKISGKVDLRGFRDGGYEIEDYKRVSVWTVIHGLKKEWDQQGNIYAWLLRENGFSPVKSAAFIGWIRNWERRRAQQEADYPNHQVVRLEADLRDHEWVTEWLRGRLKLHLDADNGVVPECTAEERWASDDRFAVKKNGNKKATRVLDTEEEAIEWITKNGNGGEYAIETRKGESTRCEGYCDVAAYCGQYKKIKEEKEIHGTS